MQAKAFFAGIRAIHVALPFGKKIDDESLTFLWMTVDSSVKRDVTDEMWAHACKELIANWNPDFVVNRPIHIQALSYLYRQRDGAPAFDWGMKEEICKQFSPPANYGRTQPLPEIRALLQDGVDRVTEVEYMIWIDRQLPGFLIPVSIAASSRMATKGLHIATSCAMVSTTPQHPSLASS